MMEVKRFIKIINFVIHKIIFLILILILFGCNKKYKDVKFEGQDLMYACGDCYPDFRVDHCEGCGDIDLLGKLIYVEFYDSEKEVEYDKQVGHCAICYKRYFIGDLFVGTDTILKVKTFRVELNIECCEDDSK